MCDVITNALFTLGFKYVPIKRGQLSVINACNSIFYYLCMPVWNRV